VTEMHKHTQAIELTGVHTKAKTNTHSRHRRNFKEHLCFTVFLCLLVWVMLSSGAELSHCEQRGNQSLFTNQLSSVPGWREDTKNCLED